MKAKRVRDPITGKMRWQEPSPDLVRDDLLKQVERCVEAFRRKPTTSVSQRYRNLKYRLMSEFGIDAPPLY